MWPEAEETAGLLKRVENCEPYAADRLWERHRSPLRKLISFRIDPRLARRVDASDVVQEVLFKANRRLGDIFVIPGCRFISGYDKSPATTWSINTAGTGYRGSGASTASDRSPRRNTRRVRRRISPSCFATPN